MRNSQAVADWSLRVLSDPSSISQQQRQLLARLAAKQLARRQLLPGNLLVLPLLGCNTVWLLEAASAQQSGQQGDASSAAEQPAATAVPGLGKAAPCQATMQTRYQLLWPEEVVQDVQQGQQKPASGTAAAAGTGPGAASSAATIQQLQELVAAAAQQSAQGSAQEAAVEAAQRAWQYGRASGGLDVSSLGGISGHMATLSELVTVPLR